MFSQMKKKKVGCNVKKKYSPVQIKKKKKKRFLIFFRTLTQKIKVFPLNVWFPLGDTCIRENNVWHFFTHEKKYIHWPNFLICFINKHKSTEVE